MKWTTMAWMVAGALALNSEHALAGASQEELLLALDAGQSTVGSRLTDSDPRPDEIKEAADECLRAVDSARKGGLGDGTQVDLGFSTPHERLRFQKRESDGHYVTTVGDIAAFCRSAVNASKLVDVERILWETHTATESSRNSNRSDYSAQKKAQDCKDAVDRALTDKISPDEMVSYAPDKAVRLGDAKKICQELADVGAQIDAARRAKRDAEAAPFRKLLSGDKLRIFNERFVDAYAAGKGGTKLTTPQAMASASLWFEVWMGNPDAQGWAEWTIRRYEFNGMKLVKGPKEKKGRVKGNYPPAAAFR